MPPTLRNGRTAIAMTMIPAPPKPWSKARHKRMPFGSWSRPVKVVAPVVVRPDIASK